MIVLDLEWNRGYDKTPLDEILQIGAVRLNSLHEPISDVFCVFIRPRVHKRISSHSKSLPELQQSLESQLDFPTAYAAFQKWCDGETVFAQWGHDDHTVLQKNCKYWNLPVPTFETVHDFQWAFSDMMDQGRQIRLCDAAEYLGFPTSFCFHNALNDAMYTAFIGAWMGENRAFAHKPPKQPKSRKHGWIFSQESFPPQPKWRSGPFSSRRSALNAKTSRRPLCPICQEKGLVNTWYYTTQNLCYGPFRCPEHGAFLSRLTLSPLKDGTWTGRLSVPVLTQELLSEFEATHLGGVHRCRSTKNRRARCRRLPKDSN